jgi:TM2 domain-containing membrane protein YozV
MDFALFRTLTLSLAFVAGTSLAQTPERDFGYSLFLLGQDDPYRAVSALKRLSYDANQTPWADKANLLIGRIYAEQQEAQAAVYHFTLVADGGTGAFNAPAQLLMWQQLCKNPPQMRSCVAQLEQATDAWNTGLPQYLRLYYSVLLGDLLNDNVRVANNPVLQQRLAALVTVSQERQRLSLKSPLLAGLLSAVLPGLGQLYAGRWVDAVVALLVNTVLIGGTVLLALPPTSSLVGAIVLGVFASGFYGGSIYNAVSDANRANEAIYAKFASDLEARFYPRVTLGVSGAELVFGYRFGIEPGIPLSAPAARP